MSNLEELIEKLCPDGVEYKKIGELVDYEQPGNYIVCSTKYSDEYNIPVLTAGQTFILGYINETDGVYKSSKDNPVIIFDDFTAAFKWVDFEFKVKSSAIKILTVNNTLTTIRYIYHVMGFLNISSDEHKRLWIGTYSNIKVPVPPLEVQREIVRILDNFTFLTTELAAELAARQKQYEYYRDLLFLSLKAEYRFIPEFAKTYIGLVTTMTQHYVKEGVKLLFNSSVKENHFDFPKMVYLDNEFAEKNSSRMHKLGDIITVHTGDVGTSAIIDETLEGSLGFATIVTRIYNQEDVLPKYVSYYLNSNENKNNIYKLIKGDRNNLNLKDFNKLRVPIPPLEQQQRIVDILDRFDALCNDITSGLPAEIEMRQKQYEYYRDKLLTFKELKKEA